MPESAIFTGKLSHQRLLHKHHAFDYRVFMVYLDLDELDEVFSRSLLWSCRFPALARFKNEDFFYDETKGSVKNTVSDFVEKESGNKFTGRVRLLTNLRYFGFQMNPLSCYYCFNEDNELEYIVAEVTNTPWKERHHYLLEVKGKQKIDIEFSKQMHVSPFMENNMIYRFLGNIPPEDNGDRLFLTLQNMYEGKLAFQANLDLVREEINSLNMFSKLIQFPFMTVKVFAAIHWQALKIYLKGVPVVKHVNQQELVDES